MGVAKGVVSAFVEGRPNDRIGVVVFGEEAFTHVPLTLDHDTLNSVLDQVQLGVAGARGTAIGSAIAIGARRLNQIENPSRILVLLTDGQNNAGKLEPVDAAGLAAALDIRVYTVGIGSTTGATRGFFGFLGGADGLDEPTLKAIAEKTGGSIFGRHRLGLSSRFLIPLIPLRNQKQRLPSAQNHRSGIDGLSYPRRYHCCSTSC